MQRNPRRILALFFFLVSFLSLRFAAVTACVLIPLPTVLDEYEQSHVVITARVVSIEKTKEPDPIHLNIRSATMGTDNWGQACDLRFRSWSNSDRTRRAEAVIRVAEGTGSSG